MKDKIGLMSLLDRVEPTIHKKIILEEREKSNVVNTEKKEKGKYRYYICDYCGEEIKIDKEWKDKQGGVTTLSNIITKKGDLTLALHNRCLGPVLKIFEEE